jgi:mannan endo-1,4-beta-mannosidase
LALEWFILLNKGGFAQYVNWITGKKIPYPASWDPIKNKLTNGSLEAFMKYTDSFYKDDKVSVKAQQIFRLHIKNLIQRKNRYTQKQYLNDKNIFAWELANEPQFPTSEWVTETANYIKSLDSNHLVTVGLESREDQMDFNVAHKPKSIDYATVHIWAQNRGVYNMTDPSQENIKRAVNWALNWIKKVNNWANELQMPLILEEFGYYLIID